MFKKWDSTQFSKEIRAPIGWTKKKNKW